MLGPGCCCEDETCVLPSCNVVALPTSGTCYAQWTVETNGQVILEGRVVSNGSVVSDLAGLSGSLDGTVAVTGSGVSVYVRTKCGSTESGPVTSCPPPPDYCSCIEDTGGGPVGITPVSIMPYVTFSVTGNAIGLPFHWGYRSDVGGVPYLSTTGVPIAAPADVDMTADYVVECDINTRVYPVYVSPVILTFMGLVSSPPGRYSPRIYYDCYYAAHVAMRYCHDGFGGYLVEFVLNSGYILWFPGVVPPSPTGNGLSSRTVRLKFNTNHPYCPDSLVVLSDTGYMGQHCNPFWTPTCRPPIDCYDVSGLGVTWDLTYGPPTPPPL